MAKTYRILYMNSFSRSGETLMLRTLNAHRKIHVLHQLHQTKDEIELQYDIFKKIKYDKPTELRLETEEIEKLGIEESKEILLVKNAIFLNRDSTFSFELLRNPFSVFASYQKLASNLPDNRMQMKNWAKNINGLLIYNIKNMDFLDAFFSIYLYKVSKEIEISDALIRYEDFVEDHRTYLSRLLEKLGIEWDEAVVSAETKYADGEMGHGGIHLWHPIDGSRAWKLPRNLSKSEKHRIFAYTAKMLERYYPEIDLGKYLK